MREQTCCIVGDGDMTWWVEEVLEHALYRKIDELIEEGVRDFYSRCNFGFELMAAEAVLLLRRRHKDVRLILTEPYPNEKKVVRTGEELKRRMAIKIRVNERIYVSKHNTPGSIEKCNRFLVDSSKYFLYYLNSLSGEVPDTMRYARTQGLIMEEMNVRVPNRRG